MEANIRWTKRRWKTKKPKPTAASRLLNGTFENFLECFMYDDELEYKGAHIMLGGPLADFICVFDGSGQVRENSYLTKTTVEEAMAKYRTAARDKILQRANARQSQNANSRCLTFAALPKEQNVEFFKPNKRVHNLAIVGYVISDEKHPDNVDGDLPVGTLWPSRTYYIHNNVGPDESAVICPAQTWGERCPICEYAKQRRKEGDATKEELQALRPKQRQLFNVIDLDSDSQDIKLMDMSYHLFGKTLDKELKDADDENVVDFYLPDGYNLRARFEKKSFNGREFWECDRVDFKERKNAFKDSIIDKTLPLDDLLNHMEYKQLEELFVLGGDVNPGDVEEDGEGRLERRRDVENRRGRRADADEDDDDTPRSPRRGSEDNDNEQDDEPPARGRGHSNHKDEDDNEPPARGRGRRNSEPDDDEEAPRNRRGSRRSSEQDDDDNQPSSGRRNRRDSENDDEKDAPRSSSRGRKSNDNEDEDTPPRGRRNRSQKDDDNEQDDEPPARGRGKSKNECPQGLRFGKDCDTIDECDNCNNWSACSAAMRD